MLLNIRLRFIIKYMKKILKYYYTIVAVALALAPSVLFANANGVVGGIGTGGSSVAIQNPVTYSTFSGFMEAILDIVVKIGAPIAIVMVIYSGMLFVLAKGNEEKLTEAKRALLWSLVGTVVLLGAAIIANAIDATIQQITP